MTEELVDFLLKVNHFLHVKDNFLEEISIII